MIVGDPVAIASAVSEETDSDVFFYNGTIQRGTDFEIIQRIHDEKKKTNALLMLVTQGGNPHAAYKIARYIQDHYQHFTVLVPGSCKSAGTLLAVGANCIAFAPYGELGPIDIQTIKTDNLAERQSGLTITESIDHLTRSALKVHGQTFAAIMRDTDAVISFKTAAQAASELVTGLYAPIFSQIDPVEVGEKARSMRIASDYGRRLNTRARNLKDDALEHLTQTYPSHSFVIDMQEAESLFKNVRALSENEQRLVEKLDVPARREIPSEDDPPLFMCLSNAGDGSDEEYEQSDEETNARRNGEDTPAATEAPVETNQDRAGLHVQETEATSARK